MNHTEWLEWRRGGLGSSDIPQILLEPPDVPGWASPFKVWASKVNIAMDDRPNEAMAEGNRLELSIAQWYVGTLCELIEHDYSSVHFNGDGVNGQVHPDHPWLRATPDFLLWMNSTEWVDGEVVPVLHNSAGLECKHVFHPDQCAKWYGDAPPLHVVYQVNVQMMVFDRAEWHVAALLRPTVEFKSFVVKRDEAICERILVEGKAWWDKHVVGNVEPPGKGWDQAAAAVLAAKYNAPGDVVRESSMIEEATIVQLGKARCDFEEAKKTKTHFENELRLAIGNDKGIASPYGRVTWSTTKGRARLDVARLRKERPEVADEFTTIGAPTRTLRFTPPKE